MSIRQKKMQSGLADSCSSEMWKHPEMSLEDAGAILRKMQREKIGGRSQEVPRDLDITGFLLDASMVHLLKIFVAPILTTGGILL